MFSVEIPKTRFGVSTLSHLAFHRSLTTVQKKQKRGFWTYYEKRMFQLNCINDLLLIAQWGRMNGLESLKAFSHNYTGTILRWHRSGSVFDFPVVLNLIKVFLTCWQCSSLQTVYGLSSSQNCIHHQQTFFCQSFFWYCGHLLFIALFEFLQFLSVFFSHASNT